MKLKKIDLYFYEMLRDYLHKYLAVQRKFSAATVKNYTDSLDQYRKFLRDQKEIPFDKVGFPSFNKNFVYDFCIWLRDSQTKSINTVNLRLSAIKSFLKYCSEEDITLSELYLKVKTIHRFNGKTDPKLEYLNQEQLETVFAAPDIGLKNGRRNQYFMIHAYETGGRIEELLSMTLGDIIRNRDSVQIRLHGKGNKTRYIPFPTEAIPHLDAYLAEFHPDGSNDDYLFYTIHGGRHTRMAPRTVNTFLTGYAKVLHKTDLSFPENLHCHVFRHSIGMAMYKAGIPISYIKDFLGHSSIDSTAIYAHADNDTMEEALRSVDQEALPVIDEGDNVCFIPEKNGKAKKNTCSISVVWLEKL